MPGAPDTLVCSAVHVCECRDLASTASIGHNQYSAGVK